MCLISLFQVIGTLYCHSSDLWCNCSHLLLKIDWSSYLNDSTNNIWALLSLKSLPSTVPVELLQFVGGPSSQICLRRSSAFLVSHGRGMSLQHDAICLIPVTMRFVEVRLSLYLFVIITVYRGLLRSLRWHPADKLYDGKALLASVLFD